MPSKRPELGDVETSVRSEVVLETLKSLAPAIGEFLGEACEVVVHDLRHPERSIVGLVHGEITGRVLGGPLVGGPFGDVALRWLTEVGELVQHQVYETRTSDGRRLKSATTLFRESNRKPFAALCINYDVSDLVAFQAWAERLRSLPAQPDEGPSTAPASTVDEILNGAIDDVIGPYRDVLPSLTRETRAAVLRELDDRGVFLVKGSVRRIADELGVSKYTVYNDLDDLRGR